MKSEFTRPPWFVQKTPATTAGFDHLIFTGSEEYLCWVKREKDAHLMVSAPDLYRALEAMLEDGVWVGCDWVPSDNAKQRADAAMAKARGEQS